MRRRIFFCSVQAFMVINGTVARHAEHAAQDWIKWRRENVTGTTGGVNLFFVILLLIRGFVRSIYPHNLGKMTEENNAY